MDIHNSGKPVTAIVYNTGWYIYNFRRRLIAALQDRGHRVVAICPRDLYVERLKSLNVEWQELKLSPLSTSPIKELGSLVHLFIILWRLRPQYVLSFTIKCNLYTGLCRRLLGFTQIANISGLGQVFERSGVVHRVACLLYKVAMQGASCVFFQNREDFQICTVKGLAPFEASKILPGSGVDLDKFRPSFRPDEEEKRRFLIFGRLLPKKGFDEFIEAAKYLRGQFGDTVECMVLGSEDSERPESVALRKRIEAGEAEGYVTYHDFAEDVRPILADVDVVVLPSTYNEGVPRCLLEALASGKPIITTDWKGCRETVRHGENGFLVPPGDNVALSQAMEALFLAPVAQLRSMGVMSRRLAEARFDERLVIDSYLEEVDYKKVA